MGSKEDRRKELEAELAELDKPDPDESYEVEFWEEDADGKRRGGRMPWAKGKAVYGSWFPELFGDKPADDEGEEAPKDDAPGTVKRFGRTVGRQDKAG